MLVGVGGFGWGGGEGVCTVVVSYVVGVFLYFSMKMYDILVYYICRIQSVHIRRCLTD